MKEIHHARAGPLWNILCCPFTMTIGLLYRSIKIYVAPCGGVLCFRLGNCLWRFLCCCYGWPYEDNKFFGATALGDFSAESEEEMEAETDWVRAQDLDLFKDKRPQLFEGEIEPGDLCQGAVGNCWLVAALASAAEFPDMIRRMFVTREYNPRGKYKVRIYDPFKKKFVKVIVDDRIPCKKGTKQPRFMKPNGNELWAILIEKAYAKYVGSYATLDGGFTLWGWHTMTGDNVFRLSRNADPTWKRQNMVPNEEMAKENIRSIKLFNTDEKYTEEDIWTLLKEYDEQKALISASIDKMDRRKTDGPNGEQMLEQEGLYAGHAYSVIQAVNVREGDNKFRLMEIRNPWGKGEWKGAWSDNSDMWKKHPSIANELNFTAAIDGSFWMAYDDFKNVYTRIEICDRSTHKDASLDVNEDKGSCGIFWGFCCGCLNFWVCCKGVANLYCSHETTSLTRSVAKKTCCGCDCGCFNRCSCFLPRYQQV